MRRCFIIVTIILCLCINPYAVAWNGHGALVGIKILSSPFDSKNLSLQNAGPNKDGIVAIKGSILTPQYSKVNNLRERFIWIVSSCQIEEEKNSLDDTMRSGQSTENENGDQNVKECPEIRPEICTQDYRPVCAEHASGDMKTYSNGCNACTDPAVIGYREGACD